MRKYYLTKIKTLVGVPMESTLVYYSDDGINFVSHLYRQTDRGNWLNFDNIWTFNIETKKWAMDGYNKPNKSDIFSDLTQWTSSDDLNKLLLVTSL